VPKIRQPSAEERELYQRVFLNQVNGPLPVVLEELRSHVLPTLDAANHALYAAALDNWCERWGMGDEWVRRFAIDTLKYWQVTEVPEGERLSWRFPDAVPNPIVPSRRGKRRARNELDDFTFRWQETEDGSFLPQAELERFARWRRKRGLDDPKRARRHRPTSESEHFQWLAIYHLASRLPGAEHRRKRLLLQSPLFSQWESPGFQLIPEVAPRPNEAIFDKIAMSAFVGTPLEMALRDCGIAALAIVGVAMEVGFEPTVRHAADLGFIPAVVTDACGGRDLEARQRSLAGLAFAGDAMFTDARTIGRLLRGARREATQPVP
jgi:nicotinamidase-related amidase